MAELKTKVNDASVEDFLNESTTTSVAPMRSRC